MAKTKKVKAKKRVVKPEPYKPADEVVYRCNLCGKVNKTKDCCGNDFTKSTRLIQV